MPRDGINDGPRENVMVGEEGRQEEKNGELKEREAFWPCVASWTPSSQRERTGKDRVPLFYCLLQSQSSSSLLR